MAVTFTLEYWMVDDKFAGRIREIPPVTARGATLEELERNIREAYFAMLEDQTITIGRGSQLKEIEIDL